MSQVHPVLLRGLLTEAAGEVGAVLGRWPGARRRGAHSAEKEAGDSLFTAAGPYGRLDRRAPGPQRFEWPLRWRPAAPSRPHPAGPARSTQACG